MKLIPDGVKNLFVYHPPLVTFLSTILIFGCGLFGIGWYVKGHSIFSPDVTQDWNIILNNFQKLGFCCESNATTQSLSILGSDGKSILVGANVSVQMTVKLKPQKAFHGLHENVTHLATKIKASDIGIKDSSAEILAVAALGEVWPSVTCNPSKCRAKELVVCVTLFAHSGVFLKHDFLMCNERNTTTDFSQLQWMSYSTERPVNSSQYCSSGLIVSMKHVFNPLMNAMLSMGERTLVNLHLIHTGYFLFVMVLMLFVFTSFRNRTISLKSPVSLSANVPFTKFSNSE